MTTITDRITPFHTSHLDLPDDARYTYADARQRFEQFIRQVDEA